MLQSGSFHHWPPAPLLHTSKFPVEAESHLTLQGVSEIHDTKWGHTFDSFSKNIPLPLERKGKNKIYDFWLSIPYSKGNYCPINYEKTLRSKA